MSVEFNLIRRHNFHILWLPRQYPVAPMEAIVPRLRTPFHDRVIAPQGYGPTCPIPITNLPHFLQQLLSYKMGMTNYHTGPYRTIPDHIGPYRGELVMSDGRFGHLDWASEQLQMWGKLVGRVGSAPFLVIILQYFFSIMFLPVAGNKPMRKTRTVGLALCHALRRFSSRPWSTSYIDLDLGNPRCRKSILVYNQDHTDGSDKCDRSFILVELEKHV